MEPYNSFVAVTNIQDYKIWQYKSALCKYFAILYSRRIGHSVLIPRMTHFGNTLSSLHTHTVKRSSCGITDIEHSINR